MDRGRNLVMLIATAIAVGVFAPLAGAYTGDRPSATRASTKATAERTLAARLAKRKGPRDNVRLYGGRIVTVWRVCVVAKGLSGKKRAIEVEETRLVPLRRAANSAEQAMRRFLAAHPERSLAPGPYARYKELDQAYRLAVSRFNGQVKRFNAAVKAHNNVLQACRI